MSKWANRSLPVTARLRSRFFINIGGRSRLGTEPMRFFVTLGGPEAHGHFLPVTAR
ncbi:MAG: hypothetical protein ABSH09_03020 [Bryobacteraceae bacterium]